MTHVELGYVDCGVKISVTSQLGKTIVFKEMQG